MVITKDDCTEKTLQPALFVFHGRFLQPAGRHHRYQREGDHSRNQNRDRQRHCELPEQATHHIAHEQQRNQYGNQRHGQRNDCETNLRGAGDGGLHRRHAFFDVTRDVFNHDNCVIDYKAGRNRQCHQAQVIQGVAQHVHRAASTHQ